MPPSENPTSLFSEFKVRVPENIPHENGCQQALEPFGIPISPTTPFSQILPCFLVVFINSGSNLLLNQFTAEDTRRANGQLLANEMNIPIRAQAAETEIQALYDQKIDPARIARNQGSAEELAVIVLKLALDYAHANWPKIKLGEQREEFLPVCFDGPAELVIANTLEIFLHAETQGVDIEKYVQLLRQLQIDLWRSELIQMFKNFEKNMANLNAGLRLVDKETKAPITLASELELLTTKINELTDKIGRENIQDLKQQFDALMITTRVAPTTDDTFS
ncbi:MAG: hypothetical protein WCW30_03110 [Candidatus Gracilibacteria bacterium]